MKVLILYPNLPMMTLPPLSIGLFNAILKEQGCEVRVFDTRIYSKGHGWSNKHVKMEKMGGNRSSSLELESLFNKDQADILPDLVALIEDFQPDFMLLSIMEDVWTITKQLLKEIRHYNIPTLAGGIFVMSSPQLVIDNEDIDAICIHEGEHVVKNIVNTKSFDVKGVWYKNEQGEVVKNPSEDLAVLGTVTPDFDCFETELTSRPIGGKLYRRVLSMETVRGCPYNCAYCGSPGIKDLAQEYGMGNFLRRKPISKVDEELGLYAKTYKPDLIMFQDDSFLARPEQEVIELSKVLAKHAIPFWVNTRIENCTPTKLAAIKEAGVLRIGFGIESGNEEYRKQFLFRNVSNETYYEYLEYINESNIPYSLNAIIGFPFETREMVLDTARLIHRAQGYDGISVFKFQTYHGTKLRDVAIENGFLDPTYVNSENLTDITGGMLANWVIRMPGPYLQPDEVDGLIKCFALYSYYPEEMWDKVQEAETNDELYDEMLEQYKAEFFSKYQLGGKDRIARRK